MMAVLEYILDREEGMLLFRGNEGIRRARDI